MHMLLNTSMAVIRNFPLKRMGSAFRGAKADLANADICQVLSLHFRYVQNLTLGTLEKGHRLIVFQYALTGSEQELKALRENAFADAARQYFLYVGVVRSQKATWKSSQKRSLHEAIRAMLSIGFAFLLCSSNQNEIKF